MGGPVSKDQGQKFDVAEHLYLLVLGQTGAGKSTLINTFKLWEQLTLARVKPEDTPLNVVKNPQIVIPIPPCKNQGCECSVKGAYLVDKFYADSSSESAVHDTSQSQTSKSQSYTFRIAVFPEDDPPKPKAQPKFYVLHIIDTPGFGDTRWVTDPTIEQRNIANILQTLVSRNFPCINAIVYMFNASSTRSTAIAQVVESLTQVLPKCFDNLFAFSTNTSESGTLVDIDQQLSFLGKKFSREKLFSYNNGLFSHYYPGLKEATTDAKPRKKKHEVFQQAQWESMWFAVEGVMSEFVSAVASVPPAELTDIERIKQANEKLELTLTTIVAEIGNLIKAKGRLVEKELASVASLNELQRKRSLQEKHEADARREKNRIEATISESQSEAQRWDDQIQLCKNQRKYQTDLKASIVVPRQYKKVKKGQTSRLIDVGYTNTLCVFAGCTSVCHGHCSLEVVQTTGDVKLKGCAAMQGDSCRHCKHGYEFHHHAAKEWQEEDIYDDVLDSDAMDAEKKKMEAEIDREVQKIDDTIQGLEEQKSSKAQPPSQSETLLQYTRELDNATKEVASAQTNVEKAEKEVQLQKDEIKKIDEILTLLKARMRSEHQELSAQTYAKEFSLYLSARIVDWKQVQKEQKPNTERWVFADQMVELFQSMSRE